jgi:hypothetical protein
MAFNANFDVQSVLNKILVPPLTEDSMFADLNPSVRSRSLVELKTQIASGLDFHYRKNFEEILDHTSRIMSMQSDLNNRLEERNDQLQHHFLNTYASCQVIKMERDTLQCKVSDEAARYQALYESHQALSDQLLQMNQSAFENEQIFFEMHNTITRLTLMLEISRSMSVNMTAVAQLNTQQPLARIEDVLPASPAALATPFDGGRAVSPLHADGGSGAGIDSGVPVAAELPAAAPLVARIEELEAELHGLRAQADVMSGRLQQIECDRNALSDQMDLVRAENIVRTGHIEQLQKQISESTTELARSLEERSQACFELSQARLQIDDLTRRLRVAEHECERRQQEKADALKCNKHLEEINKGLKQRFNTVKESVSAGVKAEIKKEMKKELDLFLLKCRSEAEQISVCGMQLAEDAHQAQVRYYQRTAELGARYVDALNTTAELRAYLVKQLNRNMREQDPDDVSISFSLVSKQLDDTVRQNKLLREQLKTQDLFIHGTRHEQLYQRCLELETKIEIGTKVEQELRRRLDEKTHELLCAQSHGVTSRDLPGDDLFFTWD